MHLNLLFMLSLILLLYLTFKNLYKFIELSFQILINNYFGVGIKKFLIFHFSLFNVCTCDVYIITIKLC
jgi:hypothetical protein